MDVITAILDACVLYPAQLRSLLMYLAVTDVYRARWTEDIHQEWMRSVLRDHPDLDRSKIARVRELMNAHVRDCLVTGYERLVPALTLPDPDDRHVLAAAICCEANVIVTINLSDFPPEVLNEYGIQAQHPDEFIAHLLDLAPDMVCAAAREQRESLKNPPKTVDEYLESLERTGLPRTAATLRSYADSI